MFKWWKLNRNLSTLVILAKTEIYSSKRSCSAVGTSISQSTHSIPYRCNEPFYELRTPHWLLNKLSKKNRTPQWTKIRSLERRFTKICLNLWKNCDRFYIIDFSWYLSHLLYCCHKCFHNASTYFFFPYFHSYRKIFFSFYSKIWVYSIFYPTRFRHFVANPGCFFSSCRKEGKVL